MFLEAVVNSFFAKNYDVEDGNDNNDDEEMNICIGVDSTYKLYTKLM